MPPSARSTRSPPSSPPRRYRWWRRCRAGARPCSFTRAIATRCFRAGAAAGPSSVRRTSGSGSGGFSAEFMRWVARCLSGSAPELSIQDLGRGARDFVLDGDWMPDYLADKYADLTDTLLEEVEDRARGWRGTSTGRILGRLSPGQYPVDRRGPAFRRSGRLRDRPRDPGPLDADRGKPRGNGRGAHRPPAGIRAVPAVQPARAGVDRAAAGAAHDPLFGVARAALGRSGLSAGFSLVWHPALLGGALSRTRGSARRRCWSRRSSCEQGRI